jgi:stage V sporulation protein B
MKALKKILKVSIPATFSNLIIPIATMLDSFMIINLLVSSGYSTLISTSLYGIWGGIVQSLISLPIILIAGISTSLVPSLSGLVIKNDTNEIKQKVAFFIKLTWILAIIMFMLIYAFAGEILEFLYGDGLSKEVVDEMYYATKMLKISSVSIIYYAFVQTFTAILQAIGKSYIPFVALLIAIVFRTILIKTLVSIVNINIFGGIIANTLFLAISSIICVWYIKKWIKLDYNFWRHLLNPLIIGIIILLMTVFIDWLLEPFLNYFFAMIVSGVIGLVSYIFIVYFSRVFTKKELRAFKIGKGKITKNKKVNKNKSNF